MRNQQHESRSAGARDRQGRGQHLQISETTQAATTSSGAPPAASNATSGGGGGAIDLSLLSVLAGVAGFTLRKRNN